MVARLNRRQLLQLGASSVAGAQLLPWKSAFAAEPAPIIKHPEEAVNVFDFEPLAREAMTLPHWTYLEMGVEGEVTLRANRSGFERFRFRTRRFVDVRKIDTTTEILGTPLQSPIILAPVSSQRAFHPEGELAVARAAKQTKHHQILSTLTTSRIEEVNESLGSPVWFQLYPGGDWQVTLGLLKRAERAGCQVVALTVDLPASKRERLWRFNRADNPDCLGCHEPGNSKSRKPMFEGLKGNNSDDPDRPALTADFVKRVQDATSMRLVIKGISTAEDAADCVEMGVAGVVVSNHGGRAEESGRSTIESLPEVIETVAGRLPVLVDSGFRRGTDIYKALALGASGVCIGRPYLWGLAAFGEPGVKQVLSLLQMELEIVMRQAGAPSLSAIRRESVEFV